MFVGTNIFSYHICYENTAKDSRVKRHTDHRQTELNNMLVKKKLNEINKVGKFTQCFKDSKKIKRAAYQSLDNLQNLLIKLTVKVSAEKAWLLYHKFPFSLNPGDKPNVAQK